MKPLQIHNLMKQYGEHTAVNGLNIEVEKGEIFGLLGANGAGKTTTMRMVLGLIYPDGGEILRNGSRSNENLARLMGYLPEERGLYPKIKVSDQINYFAKLRGMTAKDADKNLKYWLERFEVPEYYDKKVEELSKGNQQKIQFIAAVIHRPEILILDEAFSGLDPVNVELLKTTVKELARDGTTILFSTHRMEHVEELCQNVCILHRSNTVLKGSIREIKQSYPKERILLTTEHALRGLENIDGVLDVTSLSESEHAYEVKIQHDAEPHLILNSAMEQSHIIRFQIMEPTMNEIFIKAVGGEGHE